MSTKGYRRGNAHLDRTVESLLDITNEYNPQWSNAEYRDLAERFGRIVGMYGETCRADPRERQQRVEERTPEERP